MPVELVAAVLEVLVCRHNGRKQGVCQRPGWLFCKNRQEVLVSCVV